MPTFINPITIPIQKNHRGLSSSTAPSYDVTLYEGDGSGAAGPWLGFYTDKPITNFDPLDLTDSLDLPNNFCVACAAKNGGCYVMAASKPADLDAFLDILNTFILRLNFKERNIRRYFIWVAKPDATSADALNANAIPFITSMGAGGAVSKTVDTANLKFNGASNLGLQIPAGQTISLTGEQFTLTASSGAQSIQFTVESGTAAFGESNTLSLDFSNAGGGQLSAEIMLKLGADQPLEFGEVGGAVFTEKGGKEAVVSYPLINKTQNSRLQNGHYDLVLDPANPYDSERTALVFRPRPSQPEMDLFNTPWKTNLGQPIFLKPVAGNARLVLAQKSRWKPYSHGRFLFEEALYFTLGGDFELFLDDAQSPGLTDHLRCGISGTETIEVHASDIMTFFPGKPGYPSDFMGFINDEPGLQFKNARTSSWINLRRPAGLGNNQYFSQPEEAPLFMQPVDGSGATIADNPVLSLFSTPSAEVIPGEDNAFPMVPAGSVDLPLLSAAILEDTLCTEEDYSLLETLLINPARDSAISRAHLVRFTPRSPSGSSVATTSPQGFIVDVDRNTGQWLSLLLANNTDLTKSPIQPNLLEFTNLTPTVQNAFQTNELFLVVSQPPDTELRDFFTDNFDNEIQIAGWPMLIDTMDESVFTNTSDFNNVFIIKYAKGAITEKLNELSQWTNPAAFNDPDRFTDLQDWISQFIADTRSKIVGPGATPSQEIADRGFQQFLDIVDDPNWMGILAMQVSIDLQQLPEAIRCIIAGVDTDRFNAHHFGVEANQMKLDGSGLLSKDSVRSSLFGLVSYFDEDFEQRQAQDSPPAPAKAASDYEFKVLNLQVLFQNSEIADFNCNIQLSLNKLFGDEVAGEQVLDPEATLANSIILKGSFQKQNGKGSYIFTQEIPDVFSITSHFLEQTQISHINFFAGQTANAFPDGTSSPNPLLTTRFALKGEMKFHQIHDFDIFSYDKLLYTNLYLDMVFDLEDTGGKRFFFAPNETRFIGFSGSSAGSGKSVLRDHSLVGNFPMAIEGVSSWQPFAANPKKPVDQGFLNVEIPSAPDTTKAIENDEWYALRYRINLGTPGALAEKGDFDAILLLAWSPGSVLAALKPAQVFVKMPFTKGGSQVFSLQGVLKLAVGSIDFRKTAGSPQYAMGFQNAQLDLLGLKFPAYNPIRIYLFGDPDNEAGSTDTRHLGWYGAYKPEINVSLGEGGVTRTAGVSVQPQNPLFELRFLGLGQRVALQNVGAIGNVEAAVSKMSTSFDVQVGDPVKPEFGDNLKFDPNSNWMFGISAGILNLTQAADEDADPDATPEKKWLVDLSLVFNDPNLYGARLGLNGDKAKELDGLVLEVMYKKITEDIGVYSAELKLPDAIRNLIFGKGATKKARAKDPQRLEVDLPLIGIAIYTNGGFKINLGFPYLRDFSNSFALRLGEGYPNLFNTLSVGLYFGYLKGAASLNVPKTQLGIFDPTIEFGLGVYLGHYKKVKEDIMEAELKLVIVFILEGVLGFFKPADGSDSNEVYYSIKGCFGIVGYLKGKINFSVIKAELEISLSVFFTGEFVAYLPTVIGLEVQVTVKLKVTLDLGLFDVTFNLSFKAKVETSTTLGEDRSSEAPWYPTIAAQSESWVLPAVTLEEKRTALTLDWSRKLSVGSPGTSIPDLDIYYVPQFSIGKPDDTGSQTLQAINLLFVRNEINTDSDSVSNDSEFERMCIATLAWAINAGSSTGTDGKLLDDLLQEDIPASLLYQLAYNLRSSNDAIAEQQASLANGKAADPNQEDQSRQQAPFEYEQLRDFLKTIFTFKLLDSDDALKTKLETEAGTTNLNLKLTTFPIFPELKAKKEFTGVTSETEEKAFNAKVVEEDYLKKVVELQQNYATNEDAAVNERTTPIDQPLTEIIFEDYFFLILQSTVNAAVKQIQKHDFVLPTQLAVTDSLGNTTQEPTTLESLSKHFQLSTLAIARANKEHATLLAEGTIITIKGRKQVISADETLKSTAEALSDSTGEEISSVDLAELSKDEAFLKAEVVIQVDNGVDDAEVYMVEKGDSLNTVLAAFTNISTLVQLIPHLAENAELFIYLNLPETNHVVTTGDTFLSLANQYDISIEQLIAPNLNNAGLLVVGETINLVNIHNIKLETLIEKLRAKDVFGQAAGRTNRFFMHGLRLPVDETSDTYEPMYKLNNQTFTLPTVTDPDDYPLSLSIIDEGAAAAWNSELISGGSIQHLLRSQEIALVQGLGDSAFAPDVQDSTSESLYVDQARQFTFRQQVKWKENIVDEPKHELKTVWFFGDSLQNQLSQRPLLSLNVNTQVSGQVRQNKTTLTNDKFTWATWLDVIIRKIPVDARGGAMKNNIYEVFGADAQGLEVLTALLKKLHEVEETGGSDPIDKIHLIYTTPDGNLDKGGKSEAVGNTLSILINTNLSTESNPEALLSQSDSRLITNSDHADFVKRIWKASVIKSGGFYLYYENATRDGLPDEIFDDSGVSTLRILLTYQHTLATVPAGVDLNANQLSSLEPYMNCVVLTEVVNQEEGLMYGEWVNNTDKMGKVPAGFVGFQLTRTNPDTRALDPYPTLLEKQYNLLRYEIDESQTSSFVHPGEALPIGPVKDEDTEDGAVDPSWDYRKIFPIESIINPALISGSPISPYERLGDQIPFKFSWQDNFGFIYDQASANQVTLDILFTDPLIPIGQWPAVTTHYGFQDVAGANNVVITLTFTPGNEYVVETTDADGNTLDAMTIEANENQVRNRANTDLDHYQKVFFQLQQKIVTLDTAALETGETNPIEVLKVRLSVSMSNSDIEFGTTDRTALETFLNSIKTRLSDIAGDPSRADLSVITFEMDAPITDSHPDDIYPLSVKLSFARDLRLVDPVIRPDTDSPVISVSSRIDPEKTQTPLTDPETDAAVTNPDGSAKLLTSLQAFAEDFEATFAEHHLKLAVVYQGEQNRSADEIYVVRMRNGIDFTLNYDEPVFFAPEPLSHKMVGSNKLLSIEELELKPYLSTQGLSTDPNASFRKSFDQIDPEIWANEFLETFEEILRPDLSLSIAMVDQLVVGGGTHLKEILTAKAKLAEAISLQTSLILQYDDDTPLSGDAIDAVEATAREKIRQQLLINLFKGYQIDTIVTHAIEGIHSQFVSESIDDSRKPPQFFGSVYEKPVTESRSEQAPNYSFSTGKLPLAGTHGTIGSPATDSSAIATVFRNVKDKEQNHIQVEWRYLISHLEIEIQQMDVDMVRDSNDPDDNDKAQEYFASSWLSFIRPFSYEERGGSNEIVPLEDPDFHTSFIPIPIRYYPVAPQLVSQRTSPEDSALATPPDVANIKNYNYAFTFGTEEYVAQDQLDFTVRFNAKADDFNDLAEGTTFDPASLTAAMAQFIDSKDDFLNDLETLLPQIRDLTATSDAILSQADAVLSSYSSLVNQIADHWHDLYSDRLRARSFGLGPDVITVKFTLDEPKPAEPSDLEPDPDQRFRVDLDKWSVEPSGADGVSVHLPNILMEGYETDAPIETEILDPDDGSVINRKFSFFFKKTDGSGAYVLFDEVANLPRRTVSFSELDALLVQNAWAGVSVTRNAELMEEVPDPDWQQRKTSAPFIYHTPLKVFVNPITPLIDNKQSIELADLHRETGSLPLHEHFNRLFMDLLSNIDSRGDQTANPTLGEVTVKLTSYYSYQLAENALRVHLPVSLVAPSNFRRPTSATQTTGDEVAAIQGLCTSLKDWFNTEKPEERDGQFHFDMTFYSDLADDDKPIFRLRKLFLPLSKLNRNGGTNDIA